MQIEQAPFGSHKGQPVVAYTLTNRQGLRARLISFGARLTQMVVPDRNGVMEDVVLGFDDLADYITTDTYFGATCGRYGNRIADGRFVLGGQPIEVTRNEPPNHLHGGLEGFDKHVWQCVPNEDENSLTFTLVSRDGDEGFPGQLVLTSRYVLTDDDRLLITMSGTTDKTTVLNMVHHSYWNVAGHSVGRPCADQRLTVDGGLLHAGGRSSHDHWRGAEGRGHPVRLPRGQGRSAADLRR